MLVISLKRIVRLWNISKTHPHTREEDGRFVVQLPKKSPKPALGCSRSQAVRRFEQYERSQRKNKLEEFEVAVKEYADLQHAEQVPLQDLKKPETDSYYMPMHGVVKAVSTTTKQRVVFDVSAKTCSGLSLNDTLIPSPTMYPLLTSVLIGFDQHAIGMSVDISRKVSLHPQDRDL